MSASRSIRCSSLLALGMIAAAGCGSSQSSEPVTPAPAPQPAAEEPAPQASDGPLHIGPFKLTIQKEGSQERSVIAGDAGGNISLEEFYESGQSERKKGGLQVTADGRLAGEGLPPDAIALGPDGAVVVGGVATSAVIAADGTVSKDGKDLLRFEGGKVVDLNGGFKSTVVVNGKVAQETRFTVSFEGDPATRRLAAFVLAVTMAMGEPKMEADAAEQVSAVTPVEVQALKGSKMKPATVKFVEQGGSVTPVGGWYEGLPPGKYLWVIHEKGDCSGSGKKAGPPWSGAAGHHIAMEVTKDSGGNVDQGLSIKMADVSGRALILHQDRKGRPGKAVACGVIGSGAAQPVQK